MPNVQLSCFKYIVCQSSDHLCRFIEFTPVIGISNGKRRGRVRPMPKLDLAVEMHVLILGYPSKERAIDHVSIFKLLDKE